MKSTIKTLNIYIMEDRIWGRAKNATALDPKN